MKNEYFNMIGQKAPGGKMILMAVVPDDLFGIEVPIYFKYKPLGQCQPSIREHTQPYGL